MRGDSDHELIRKSLQGNELAFRRLVERHHATAYAVVRGVLGDRDDVDDVVQLVYIKVYRGLSAFRGDASFSTWLYRIARNEAINSVRKRRYDVVDVDDVTIVASEHDSPESVMHRNAAAAELDDAMGRIDERYREVLELRYMGERSYEEITEITGLPLGTVKTYIHRGKDALRRAMTQTIRRSQMAGGEE